VGRYCRRLSSKWPMNSKAAIAVLFCLSACDTLHGLRIEAVSDGKQTLPPACIVDGLRMVGFEAVPTGGAQSGIREIGGEGFWFFASHENAARVDFYLLAMHEPIPCKDIQSVVPRMRNAAKLVREACSLPPSQVVLKETWSQTSCGL